MGDELSRCIHDRPEISGTKLPVSLLKFIYNMYMLRAMRLTLSAGYTLRSKSRFSP